MEEETKKLVTVLLEVPYRGFEPYSKTQTEAHITYSRLCMLDCLERGEAPFLSSLLYTQVWDDMDENLRAKGIAAGFAIGERLEKVVVYIDHGITEGMRFGIERAQNIKCDLEYRLLFPATHDVQGVVYRMGLKPTTP